MLTITAGELQKRFGRYREVALAQPVAVTHHGRESLVLLSAEAYARLKSFDDRTAYYAWELPDDLVKALDEVEIPAGSAQFDHECE